MSIQLLDIVHGNGLLVDPRLNQDLVKIFENINPRKNNVAICVEGLKFKNGNRLNPDDSFYKDTVRKLWPSIFESGSFPRIPVYGNEPRSQVDLQSNVIRKTRLIKYLWFLDNCVVLTQIPQTISESLEWIKNGQRNFKFLFDPDAFMVNMAEEVLAQEVEWVKSYHELATTLSKSHDEVYVVAGASHVLSLHFSFGWPVKWFTKSLSITTPENVYRWYMNYHGFSEAILGR